MLSVWLAELVIKKKTFYKATNQVSKSEVLHVCPKFVLIAECATNHTERGSLNGFLS